MFRDNHEEITPTPAYPEDNAETLEVTSVARAAQSGKPHQRPAAHLTTVPHGITINGAQAMVWDAAQTVPAPTPVMTGPSLRTVSRHIQDKPMSPGDP